MTKEEEEKYLDTWGPRCLLCNEEVPRYDRCLVSSIVPLDNLPPHAVGPVSRFYMVCSTCKDKGELV